MYAYLIDPVEQTVEPVERRDDDGTDAQLAQIYQLLDCDTIDAVRPHNAQGDVIYIDDLGKVRDDRAPAYFLCRLWPNDILAGKALWVGTTFDGYEASPACDLDYVRAHIVWVVKAQS